MKFFFQYFEWAYPVICAENREFFVGNFEDFKDGGLKTVFVGRKRILVCKVNGQLYAVGNKCPHQGAALEGGFLNGTRLVCPLHGAEFELGTGKLVNPPGYCDLKTYEVVENEGRVFVRVDKIEHNKIEILGNDLRRFVIIGSGAAGMMAAETLRKEGFRGKIFLISDENILPYDRVLLSKSLFLDKSNISLFTLDHFKNKDYILKLDTRVKEIHQDKIVLDNGEILEYDKLLVSTGASAKVPMELSKYLNVPNFLTMRNFKDYERIQHSIESSNRICIVGNRFLGLELAATIKKTYPDIEICFIEYEKEALAKVVGPYLYTHIFDSLSSNNVNIIKGEKIEDLEINNGKISAVLFNNHKVLTDLVIVSTGSTLKTAHIPEVLKNQDGSVKVNEFLSTEWENVFAAGDIAEFPDQMTGSRQRIEHWVVAQQQGSCAGLNMLNKNKRFDAVPYFWSQQFDYIEMAGYCFGADNVVNEEISDVGKISYFFKGEKCIGVAAVNLPMVVLKLKIALGKGTLPTFSTFLAKNLKTEDILQELGFYNCPNQ